MSEIFKSNKFFVTALVITIVLAGMTFGNMPGPATALGSQTIDGTTFAFADYWSVDHEMLAAFNFLDTLVNDKYQGYAEWDGFGLTLQYEWALHYVLAFAAYATQMLFESTPGYRTEYYRDFSYDLIQKFNTSEAEYGQDSIEYMQWRHDFLNWDTYYWPNATDDSGVYVGDFRGPANIMWTAHFALMELLHERNFNAGTMVDEITWFIEDWNNTLTTDGFGNPQVGGIWEAGTIPCEPYVIYTQCNAPPVVATALYDNLYGTDFLPVWDYGLNFMNTVMQDQYDLMSDGWYVYEPVGFELSGVYSFIEPDEFPGLAQ
ncbi:MAG: linalool dehydratase/isomerase domain-containing protein, partial [Candidatus Thorarchaeota archaeon]